ncbi:MAG TPA: peptidoglycan DD-metalloendopeptidase family protein [Symbiobacteriaceae bacterium]
MPSQELPARRRWLATAVAAVALVGLGAQMGHAGPQDDLNRALEEQRILEQQRQQAENELQRVYGEAEVAQRELAELDQELAEAEEELDMISTELAVTEAELAALEADLRAAQERHDERMKLLGRRLRVINEEGQVHYLEVLLGSRSIQEFLTRLDMLKELFKQDARLLDEIREEKRQIAAKQEQVEARRTQLVALKERAEEQYNMVAARRAEREIASRQLDQRKRELEAMLDAMEEEARQIQYRIWLAQQQMARPGDGFAPIYPVSGFVITDTFGPRLHPILGTWRNHYGTDFAVPYGTPVHAIEDGVVILAEWSDTYGNLIVIDHGGGIASWYAHNSEFRVRVGDVVRQGDVIALAGSTGWSTGPHVHLEIHVDGVPQDPMSFLP